MEIKFLGNWASHIQAGKRNVSIIIDGHILLDCGPHTIESMLDAVKVNGHISGILTGNLQPIAEIRLQHLSHMGDTSVDIFHILIL